MKRVIETILIAILLVGCTGLKQMPPVNDVVNDAPYRLDSGDQIRLIVLESSPLSGEYAVSDAGTISIPLLGSVPARGRSVEELETDIAEQLRREYFEQANVSVEIKSFRPFFVLGQVSRPGQYPYQAGMNVLTAVAIAGGFTQRAITDEVSIVRTVKGKAQEGRAARDTSVLPGDVVYVHERFF
jgi:polysaccharide biosynthesis/export protein